MTQKVILAVIVYNRLENIKRWIDCWKVCEQEGAEMFVIHNCDKEMDHLPFQSVCESNGISYIRRDNIGFDIGAFQDVCRGRLSGFPKDWDLLFWVTDDTVPMSKKFLGPFIQSMKKPEVGIACLEISKEVNLHVRTSGFCIRKTEAEQLTFAADPVTTKQQCYLFEHLGNAYLAKQISQMGFRSVMPIQYPKGDLWDTHHRANHKRWKVHEFNFGKVTDTNPQPQPKPSDKKVTVICPIYNSYPQIVSSMICQTHQNWELILMHDGPNSTGLLQMMEQCNDKRIVYIEHKERANVWGHNLRKWALENIDNYSPASDYVLITNPDNYYVPVALEYLLAGFNNGAVATYCDKFVHGYLSPQKQDNGSFINHRWGVLNARPQLGYMDCGGVMVKKEVACEVGWRSMEIYSDWTYFSDIIKKYGPKSFAKIHGCLFIHN